MQKIKYNLKDITVVIPTYNRSSEILETLNHILNSKVNEILVIDQSKIKEEATNIKNICDTLYFNGYPIKYHHFNFASTAIARNKGVELSSKESKIISFIDDDVSVQDNYFKTIIDKFNNNPEILGVAGYRPFNISKKEYYIDLTILKLFFLRKYDEEACRVRCPYNNTYPFRLKNDIYAQWFPGFNTAYKKEIFKTRHFDNCLGGYSLAEDIEFSYSLYLSNPKALLITPDTLVNHRCSKLERANIKKLSYINQVDHFYFYWKYEKYFSKLKHYWSLVGIAILRTFKMLDFKRKSFINWYYFWNSLFYCLKNKDKIKKGQVREWKEN